MKAVFVLGSSLALLAGCSRDGRGASGPPSGERRGCYAAEQPARAITLCLGPPRLEPGRYTLDDRMTVPGATLARHCEGRYSSNAGAVQLSPERCNGFTVNEQLGQAGPNAPQAAPAVRIRDLGPTGLGIAIGQDPELELRQSE